MFRKNNKQLESADAFSSASSSKQINLKHFKACKEKILKRWSVSEQYRERERSNSTPELTECQRQYRRRRSSAQWSKVCFKNNNNWTCLKILLCPRLNYSNSYVGR